jgi:glycine cleavage system H lipoate-binding protein
MNNNGLETNNNDINGGSSNSRWLKYMQKNKEEEEKAKELESQERLTTTITCRCLLIF